MSSKSKKQNVQSKKGSKIANKNDANSERWTTQERQLMKVFEAVQENDAKHQGCIKQVLDIHEQMPHDVFMSMILSALKKWLRQKSFDNSYAKSGLKFLARLVVSNSLKQPNNTIMDSVCEWLLITTSPVPVARQFICYFMNFLVKYANILKVSINVDEIVKHTMNFMKDSQGGVRERASEVLLNVQYNPDVMEVLLIHLNCDPSSTVRRLILKSINFTNETTPYILERLLDSNETVRCDLYSELAERDVKTLTIAQRLRILDYGYNDRSAKVQQVITDHLVTKWLQNYKNSYLALLTAIKFDANENDIKHFMRTSKYILFNLFEKHVQDGHVERLCQQLGLWTEGEAYIRCMPFNNSSLEALVFWLTLFQFGQCHSQINLEHIICDVDVFCEYILAFIQYLKTNEDQNERLENQYKIQVLVEILHVLDVDEFGRSSLRDFVSNILINEMEIFNETAISGLVKCAAKIIHVSTIGQYFYDILQSIYNKIPSIDHKIDELAQTVADNDQKLLISQLKTRILELKEEEHELIDSGAGAAKVRAELRIVRQKIIDICRDYGTHDGELDVDLSVYEMSIQETIKCLQIFYFSCHSTRTARTTPEMALFFKDIVYQLMKDENYDVRGWALKCGAAYALRFDDKSDGVLVECYHQLMANHEPKLWSIAIVTICELLDKHRIEFLIRNDDESSIVYLLFEMLERVKEETVKNALITGLCRLIVSEYIVDKNQIASVFIEYFNPNAYPSTQQIMGLFFDQLLRLKRQGCLIPALLPMFNLISTATHEKEFFKIKLKDVIVFVIAITKSTASDTTTEWHNQIAIEFINIMHDYSGNKLVDVLSEQLGALEVTINDEFKELIRRPLLGLVEELSGTSKENVKRCWKKFGFKRSDRHHVSSPEVDHSISSSVNYSRRNASATVTRGSTISRVSSIPNDENAQSNKGKDEQRSGRPSIRKAFSDRGNKAN